MYSEYCYRIIIVRINKSARLRAKRVFFFFSRLRRINNNRLWEPCARKLLMYTCAIRRQRLKNNYNEFRGSDVKIVVLTTHSRLVYGIVSG